MKFKIAFFNTTILTFKNEFAKDFYDKKDFFNREIEQSSTKMFFETTNINFDFDFEFSLIIFNFHSTRFMIKKRTRQFQRNKF